MGILDRIAVFAGLRNELTIEVIDVVLANLTIDNGVGRLGNDQLEATEHSLSVEVHVIVTIDALCGE